MKRPWAYAIYKAGHDASQPAGWYRVRLFSRNQGPFETREQALEAKK